MHVVVVVVFVLSFRQDVYVHKCLGLIVQYRYRVSHLGVATPGDSGTPPPLPPSPRALTSVGARGLQKIDSRKNSNAEHAEKYRRLVEIMYRFPNASHEQPKHRLCTSLQTAGNSWEHRTRCVNTSKTSMEHATAVVDGVPGRSRVSTFM